MVTAIIVNYFVMHCTSIPRDRKSKSLCVRCVLINWRFQILSMLLITSQSTSSIVRVINILQKGFTYILRMMVYNTE